MNLRWPSIHRHHALIIVLLAVSGPLWALGASFWPSGLPPYYLAGRDMLLVGLLMLRWRRALDKRLILHVLPLIGWLLWSATQGTGGLSVILAGLRQWLMPLGMIALGMAWGPTPPQDASSEPLRDQHSLRLLWFLIAGTLLMYALTVSAQLSWCSAYFEAKRMPYVEGVPQQWLEPVAGGLFRAAGWWMDPISNGHVWVWMTVVILAGSASHKTWGILAGLLALMLTTSKGAWLQAIMVAGLGLALALIRHPLLARQSPVLRYGVWGVVLALPLLLPWPVQVLAQWHPGIAIHWHGWSSALRDWTWTGEGIGSHGNVSLLMHSISEANKHSTTVVDSAWGSLLAQSGVLGLLLWLGTWISLALRVGRSYPLLGLLAYSQIVISMFSENAINPMAMFPLCLSLGSAWNSLHQTTRSTKPKSTLLDYVGRKAGMDYFSLRLHQGLQKAGIDNTLYSNFSYPGDSAIVQAFAFEDQPKRSFRSQIRYLQGMLQTWSGMIVRQSEHFFFHFFKAGYRELLVLMMARCLGQKIHLLVHDVQSLDAPQGRGAMRWVRHLIFKTLSDRVYVFSETAGREILGEYAFLATRLTVLKHGHFLDLPAESPTAQEARKAEGWDPGLFYILFFGQIKTSKGLDLLLQAMNRIQDPEIHLVIAGSSRDLDPQSLIRQEVDPGVRHRIHLRNRYHSDVERDSLFKACDVLVLPYRHIYNSGVLIMGLSYGQTVLASDLPANREIIQNGVNGWLFEAGNPDDLALNILRLRNQSKKPTFESIIQTLKNQHSWENMALSMRPYVQ